MKKSFNFFGILFLSIFLSVSIGLIAIASFFWYGTIAHVSLENKSGASIDRCILQVSDERAEFENVAAGEKRDIWFFPSRDDDYHVTVYFKSGIELGANLGYVTPNLGNRDKLLIFSDHIDIKSEQRVLSSILSPRANRSRQ